MTVACYLCGGQMPRNQAPDDRREPGVCWDCWVANLSDDEQRAAAYALFAKKAEPSPQ